jgi:gluconolactonase
MSLEVLDKRAGALLGTDVQIEQLCTGFGFTEGPIWHPKSHFLIFSDMVQDTRRRYSQGATSVHAKPSNQGNGMTFDARLNLLVCEHATSSVVRLNVDGTRDVLAAHFEGKELNSPNDIVVGRDGSIYFSDPTYGRMPGFGVERSCDLDFQGVYRIAPDGTLKLVVEKGLFTQPNGLCFSPDETLLYVNDTEQANIRKFKVTDGELSEMSVFASGISDPGLPGAPDGMKCDAQGNIWVTGPGGLWTFAPDGTLIAKIAMPEFVANLHWGGSDWKTLFITASTSLYAIQMNIGPHLESFMMV